MCVLPENEQFAAMDDTMNAGPYIKPKRPGPYYIVDEGVDAYASVQAIKSDTVADVEALVTQLSRLMFAQNLEAHHCKIIFDRFGAAIAESEMRNDDQSGWDVLGDLCDQASAACEQITTLDVLALKREAAKEFNAQQKRDDRVMERANV